MRSSAAMRRIVPIACALGLLACVPKSECGNYHIDGDTGIPNTERALLSVTACLNDACSRGTIDSATARGAATGVPEITLEGDATANFWLHQNPQSGGGMRPGRWGYSAWVYLPDEFREDDAVALEIHDDAAGRQLKSVYLGISNKKDAYTCIYAQVDLSQDGGGGSGGGG